MRAQVELLRSEGQSGASSADDNYPSPPPGQANGSNQHAHTAAHDVQRALNERDNNDFIHPELRAAHGQQPPANMMPMAPPPSSGPPGQPHANTVLQPQQPDLAPAANMTGGPSQDQGGATSPDGGDGRKQGSRELSQTKRAAQNRAAQAC